MNTTRRGQTADVNTCLAALIAMVEEAAKGLIHADTRKVFVPGESDMAINPEHTLFLSDARAALRKATEGDAP